jgi:phage protein D
MAAAAESYKPIYEGRDFYVPAFDIKIEGKELSAATARDIVEVRYEDSLDKIDKMELTVNNWDADRCDFKYTGSKKGGLDENARLFLPEQVVELFMGYYKPLAAGASKDDRPEPLRLMLAGKISTVAPTFPTAGQPTVKISGQSVLSKLVAKQETHHYEPKMFKAAGQPESMKVSMIAQKVGKRGNLKIGNMVLEVRIDKAAMNDEPELKYLLQNNQYDIVFLLQLAHRQGYNLLLKKEVVDDKEQYYLFFGPAGADAHTAYTLEWGKSLVQFSPTLKTAQQVMEVTVCGWDAAGKKAIKVKVDRTMLPNSPYKNKKDLEKLEEGFKEKKEVIVDKPFENEKQAREYALAQLSDIAGRMVTAHGSTLGTPDLRAGSQIRVLGLGDMFDGKYTVTGTSHVIGANGYVTEFDARMEGEGPRGGQG